MNDQQLLDQAQKKYGVYRRVTLSNNLFTPAPSFRSQLPCGPAELVREAWREAVAHAPFRDNIGLYVHIPFCSDTRCNYCMYASYTEHTETDRGEYLDYLATAADYFSDPLHGIALGSLYIGGGTPSLLDLPLLDRLFTNVISRFSFLESAEKTCELSFLTATSDKLDLLWSAGINRLSFGLQSIEPLVSMAVNRKETPLSLVSSVIARCQNLRFTEVNIDLMVGLPHETIGGICAGFSAAVRSGASAVTVYIYRHPTGQEVDFIGYNKEYIPSVLAALRQTADKLGWIDTVCDDNTEYQFFSTQKHLDSYALNAYQTRYDPARPNSVLGLGHTAFSFIGDFFRSECRDKAFRFDPASATHVYDLIPKAHRCRLYVIDRLYREGAVNLADYRQRFGRTFPETFARELEFLGALGVVECSKELFTLKADGRLDFNSLCKFFWDQEFLQELAGESYV